AEHGLVAPEQVVAPYEKTLNTMPVGERRRWASKVIARLHEVMPSLSRVVFLAGQRYREFLVSHLESRGDAVAVPMEGLQIGEQLRWLSGGVVIPNMDKEIAMAFVTYANSRSRRVVIHSADCTELEKHGGEHSYNQGEYNNHATYAEAKQYAD